MQAVKTLKIYCKLHEVQEASPRFADQTVWFRGVASLATGVGF
jgi:hypothetical protein